MINRRGFAPWLTCRSCGHHWDCPNCDVSLIVHRESGRLVCHHCAHVEPLPVACGGCGSTTLSQTGAGTEQIEALLAERLAPMPVFRLDADTTTAKGAHAGILAGFGEAESGVLVGTQMVAKGHDFPEVTLSAILDADATLRFPDFRAAERTFAMVAQLAGRSGRGAAGGEVIVQTLAPNAPSIAHAAGHDSVGFLAGEVERRRALRYPPFSHLVRVVLRAEAAPRVEEAAAPRGRAGGAPTRGRRPARPGADVQGPEPAPAAAAGQVRGREAAVAAVRGAVEAHARAFPTARRRRQRRRRTPVAGLPHSSTGAIHTIGAWARNGRSTPARRSATGLERELIERREAALAHVIKFGAPVLKSRASPVTEFGPELRAEVERMIAIMRDGLGVGLAATQLGILRRVLVVQPSTDAEPAALVNPVIERFSGDLVTAEEGCLSLPRISVDVERPLHVSVSALDADGGPFRIEASGLEARILQHEIDHLDGVLILDPRPAPSARERCGRCAKAAPTARRSRTSPRETEEHREPRTDA